MGKQGKLIDMAGQRIGMLTVLGRAENSSFGNAQWYCKCDCGTETIVLGTNLRKTYTKSCGCTHVRHGHWGTPLYLTWRNMLRRCNNPNDPGYKDYGGRGITVCERWLDFTNFVTDMGERPDGHSLDRIKVNGNYEPGNCRWATPEEQANNRRPLITHALLISLMTEIQTVRPEFAEAYTVLRDAIS